MISVDKKRKIVVELVEKLQKAQGVYLVNFEGMTVAETLNFRRNLKKEGIEMKVAKNTLILKALGEVEGLEIAEDKFFGQSALILGYDDAVAPARIIKKAFEEKERPSLKAALIEGQAFDGSQLKTIASLPSRTDLIAGILGSLNAPASGIVGAVNAVMRDLISVIDEVAKKQNNAA